MLDAGGIIPACPAHSLLPTSWCRSHPGSACDTAVAFHTAHVLFLLAAAPHHRQVLETPGMLGIVVQGARPDSYRGAIIVKVEPSRDFHPGVHFLVNDPYETTGKDQGCGEAMETLAARWVDSMAMSVGTYVCAEGCAPTTGGESRWEVALFGEAASLERIA